MLSARMVLGSVACALALAACDAEGDARPSGDGASGDCNARIRIGGTTYGYHPEAVTTPPGPVEPLAVKADVLDCDADSVGTVVPVEMDGVPTSVAVAVIEAWPGVYVAEGVAPSAWPTSLKR